MQIRRILLDERWARGMARTPVLIALSALALVGVAAGGYFALSGGSDEEQPAVLATASASPSPSASPVPATPTPQVPPLEESHEMVIEKIGVDAPVTPFGVDANQVPVVPKGPDAAHIVAWYNFSVRPGMHGNAVYAGHVTWNGQAVFFSLNSVAPGDLIHLRDARGAEAVYQVADKFSVSPTDPKSIEVILPTPDDVITIVTCGGSFYHTGDPVAGGDYTERTVVRGRLVSVKYAGAG